jgi:predicted transcriptional regulator
MRRSFYLAVGAALGASATVWSRRRAAELAAQARAGQVPAEVIRLVDRSSRRVQRHVAGAVHAGRIEARRREDELRQALNGRTRLH